MKWWIRPEGWWRLAARAVMTLQHPTETSVMQQRAKLTLVEKYHNPGEVSML